MSALAGTIQAGTGSSRVPLWRRVLLRPRPCASCTLAAAVVGSAALAWAPAAGATTTRTINFDNLTVGSSESDTIGNAYEAQGLVFGTPAEQGFSSESLPGGGMGFCGDPTARSSQLTESPPNYAEGWCFPGELAEDPEIFAILSKPAHHVSFYVGDPYLESATSENWKVEVFNSSKTRLGEKSFTVSTPGVLTPESIEAPGFEISYVRIAMQRSSTCTECLQAFHASGIDNFSFETAETIATPTLELAGLEPASVEQSRSATEGVELFREGGSKGEVRLSVAGLPSGVAAHFSGERLLGETSESSKLTLTANSSVIPGMYAVEVTATPEVSEAGTTAVQRTFMLTVTPYENSFKLEVAPPAPGETIPLRPCQTRSVNYNVYANPYFAGPVTVTAASSPVPVDMHLEQQETGTDANLFGVAPAGVFHVSRGLVPGSGPFTFNVVARNPAGESDTSPTFAVVREAPAITHVYDESAHVEEFHQYQGYVGIHGEGFCPNTRVWLGNSLAQAPVIRVSYNEVLVEVPRGATSGKLRLESDGETVEAPLAVENLRDTRGFSFINRTYGARLHQEEVEEVYGSYETHECANYLIGETCWYKPSAWSLEQLTNKVLGGEPGLCFGEAYAAAVGLRGGEPGTRVPATSLAFPPAEAATDWGLEGSGGPSAQLKRTLVGLFSVQFSDQLIPIALSRTIEVHYDPTQDEKEIEAALDEPAREEYVPGAIIGIIKWNGISPEGHAVYAYNWERLPDGTMAVDVVNSNAPYSENESGYSASNKSAHEAALEESTLYLKNGRWHGELVGTPAWEGSEADMVVFPDSKVPGLNPESPHLPNLFTASIGAVFASSEHVTEVSSAKGKLFSAGGLAPQSQWPVGVAPSTTFAGGGADPLIVEMAPGAEKITATVTDGHEGGGVFDLKGLDATLDANTAPGQVDHVTVDPQHGAVGYQPGKTTALSATLIADAGGARAAASGSAAQRTAQVHVTSAGADTLSFPEGKELVVQHGGPAAQVAVTLSAVAQGIPVEVQLPSMRLASGQKLTVSPANWAALGRTAVRLRVSGPGRTLALSTHGRTLGVRFARVTAVKLQRHGSGERLTLHIAAAHAPDGASLVVVASVRRGRVTVAQAKTAVLGGAALRKGSATLSLPKALAHGSYLVKLELAEVVQGGAIRSGVTVHQSLKAAG